MGAGVFLELLARDAAVIEYERPLVEARARRAPAAIKRLIEPSEVAEAVAHLCSPAAASITGTSLVMDGGWSAH